jgi:twinkle protein
MTKLRTLVEETGISLTIVSHLKRIEGNRGHEDGVAVSLGHLRGSQAIAQLSDQVLALSRSTTSDTKDLTTLSVLKNRYSGETGDAATLKYDPVTGRLKQTDPLDIPSESVSF